ncbi:hypothetical protein [Sphingobacterium lactis]|uniref:Erythromycin esterase n=1 Tax=Sphingobacterium lactis TaxID=797291 RepID=A0A1H5YXP1_9SPHI|nr:hypothetical protein [Sphingobacterium lactis]SEG29023.1 hypothetical protein SAMN05421877_106176 [Sphingobacterium lactis]
MKKAFKFLKYLLFGIVGLLILLFLFFYVSNRMFIGSQDEEFTSYLDNNQEIVSGQIEGKLFDDRFYDSQVFLFGEVHGFAGNQEMDLNFLKYLHKNEGVRYYIAEIDSTHANKLNQFLHLPSKDLGLLKEVVTAIKRRIPQQSSEELLRKWDNIYDYNQELADSLKISVIGIDTDYDDTSRVVSRDSTMLVNFKNEVNRLNLADEKFYGLFGFYHVLQKSASQGKTPFAELLMSSGFKVTSMVSFTLESEMYLPKNPQFPTPEDEKIAWVNADGPFKLVKGIHDFEKLRPNSINLFKLDAENSPYRSSEKLITIKSRLFGESFSAEKGTATTDYFQYVVLLKNSKALTPLK